MGDRIVLRTECRDNGEAVGALARDLDEGHLVLPADHAVEVGAWVAFEVLLRDGQSFLEGMGRCIRSEHAMQGHRVRLDDLQLDTAGELLFERIVMARDDLEHGGRQTGEIDISRLAAATHVVEPPAAPRPPPPLPKPTSALPPKPASAMPPKPIVAPKPPSAIPAPIRPPSAVPVARPAAPALPPRPAPATPTAVTPTAVTPSAATPSAATPATATPAKAPTRPPSVAPRGRPPSIVPTSPGGFPAVRPEAVRAERAEGGRPASVRAPSEGRPASVRALVGSPSSTARSGLPPAPRVPTFAPTPFVPEDTRVDLAPSDTTISALRESRRPDALEAQLQRLLPRLVAEGRVRDADELRALALRLGLEALEIVYPD